jgi:iron complex transport system substrate-binding protein
MIKKSAVGATLAALAVVLSGCATSEPAASSESKSKSEKITVTDSRGKSVTLDGPAEKVGATEWNAVEYSTSLGVQPVAVSDIKGFKTWDSAVTLKGDVTDLGTRGEPSIDTVASQGLDVLFVTDELAGNALEQIEKTTPVIVMPGGNAKDPVAAMWKNLDLVAKATGTEDEAAALREKYDAKVAETKQAVTESDLGDAPVAFSDSYEVSGAVSIRPFGEGSLIGGVMEELGIDNAWSRVPGLKMDPVYGLGETDVEGLTRLPEDTHYWYIGGVEDPDVYRTSLKDNKVWTSLPFVEAGKVTRVPDKIWMFGGPESMMQFLDAVQDAVKQPA